MLAPGNGYNGSVSLAGTTILNVNKWESTEAHKIIRRGPYIGDSGKTYSIATSKEFKLMVSCDVPAGKDSGQTTLIAAAGLLNINLVATDGYDIAGSGVLASVKLSTDANGVQTIDFEIEDSGSLTYS